MARIEERLATLEERQKAHEDAVKARHESHEEKIEIHLLAFSQRLETVEGTQVTMHETMQGVRQGIDTLVAKLDKDDAVNAALAGDRRKRKLDLKDWLIIVSGLFVALGGVLTAIQAMFHKGG